MAIATTRSQSQITQRLTSASAAPSLSTIRPLPCAIKFADHRQNTVGVEIQMRTNISIGSNNHTRYESGVFHPLISAPRIPTAISRSTAEKNSLARSDNE